MEVTSLIVVVLLIVAAILIFTLLLRKPKQKSVDNPSANAQGSAGEKRGRVWWIILIAVLLLVIILMLLPNGCNCSGAEPGTEVHVAETHDDGASAKADDGNGTMHEQADQHAADALPEEDATPDKTPDDGMRTVQGVIFEAAYGLGYVHMLTEDEEYIECTFDPDEIELVGEPLAMPGDRAEITYQIKNGGNTAICVEELERLQQRKIHGVFLQSGNGRLTFERDDGETEEMYTYSMTTYFPPKQNGKPATISYVDVPGNRKLAICVTYDD